MGPCLRCISLNIMPAPWLISNEYSWDRQYRTLSNEYKKNLAIIESAKKHDFVRSVVDLFSIELPFNGKPGSASAHNDAVHVSPKSSIGSKVLSAAGDHIIETLCNSE